MRDRQRSIKDKITEKCRTTVHQSCAVVRAGAHRALLTGIGLNILLGIPDVKLAIVSMVYLLFVLSFDD